MSYSDIKQVQNMQIPGIQIRNAQIKQCNVARTDVQLASSDALRCCAEYCKVDSTDVQLALMQLTVQEWKK